MTPEEYNKLTPKEKRKLEKLANVIEAGNSAILEHLFEIEERVDEALASVDEKVNELKDAVEPNLKDVLEQVKGKDGVDGPQGIQGPQGERGNDGAQGNDGKNGKDGRDGVDGKDGADGTDGKAGKDGEKGNDGSSDTPVQVVKKLESLEGDERLDKSAIKGLKDELDLIKKELGNRQSSGTRGMRKVPIIKKYNLTSQCNGVLKAFVLPPDTTDVIGVFGSQFPIQFDPSNDWTFSGRTLTLGSSVSAPETGQTLWALLEVLFY